MNSIERFKTRVGVGQVIVADGFSNDNTKLFEGAFNIHRLSSGTLYILPLYLIDIYKSFISKTTLGDVREYINRDHTDGSKRIQLATYYKIEGISVIKLLEVFNLHNIPESMSMSDIRRKLGESDLETFITRNKPVVYQNPEDTPRKRIRVGEEYPRYSEEYGGEYEDGEITIGAEASTYETFVYLHSEWLPLDHDHYIEWLAEERQANQVCQPQEDTQTTTREEQNMKKIRFLSRSNGLEGMTNLKEALTEAGVNAKRLKLIGSSYRPDANTIVVNWGNVEIPPSWYSDDASGYVVLNKQPAIQIAKNKKKTFEKLGTVIGISSMLPEWTTDWNVAERWSNEQGTKVFCRTLLEASSGDGIVVANTQGELVTAPLYVKGINTKHEYRVHVVNGQTLIQRKAKLNSDTPHQDVRNHENGYHFINEFTASDSMREVLSLSAKRAIEGLGLDMASVDICTTTNAMYILEVNSASGLTAPTTINFYRDNLIAMVRG